jgi:phosphopantothenoylcysteine decarboxylase/phosphopantothenate--cysteine ligase
MIARRQTLAGKTVVLAICGSIAAVETVKLARELQRRGAVVQGVMSAAAAGIITPEAVTYATRRPVITAITGMVEHVAYCGIGGSADLLLIAPCTANTIAKIAAGIDDTPVTTFATTAIGRGMPVLVAPAMHESMLRHPAIGEAIGRLASWGIAFCGPRIEEDRAKIATTEEIVLAAERAVLSGPLAGKKVLVTSGACREAVDDVRVLTTRSSGQMGAAIALEAYRLGAEVFVVHRDVLPGVRNVAADSAADMREAVLRLLGEEEFDFYVSAAAISDFAPRRASGKIPSGQGFSLELEQLPKLLDAVLERGGIRTVAFKLGWDEGGKADRLIRRGLEMVVTNTPAEMGAAGGSFIFVTQNSSDAISGSKEEVAAALWQHLL